MKVTRVGVDLAKDLFQVHGVDGQGKTVLRRKLRRSEMTTYFQKLPACMIGLQACEFLLYRASIRLTSSKSSSTKRPAADFKRN